MPIFSNRVTTEEVKQANDLYQPYESPLSRGEKTWFISPGRGEVYGTSFDLAMTMGANQGDINTMALAQQMTPPTAATDNSLNGVFGNVVSGLLNPNMGAERQQVWNRSMTALFPDLSPNVIDGIGAGIYSEENRRREAADLQAWAPIPVWSTPGYAAEHGLPGEDVNLAWDWLGERGSVYDLGRDMVQAKGQEPTAKNVAEALLDAGYIGKERFEAATQSPNGVEEGFETLIQGTQDISIIGEEDVSYLDVSKFPALSAEADSLGYVGVGKATFVYHQAQKQLSRQLGLLINAPDQIENPTAFLTQIGQIANVVGPDFIDEVLNNVHQKGDWVGDAWDSLPDTRKGALEAAGFSRETFLRDEEGEVLPNIRNFYSYQTQAMIEAQRFAATSTREALFSKDWHDGWFDWTRRLGDTIKTDILADPYAMYFLAPSVAGGVGAGLYFGGAMASGAAGATSLGRVMAMTAVDGMVAGAAEGYAAATAGQVQNVLQGIAQEISYDQTANAMMLYGGMGAVGGAGLSGLISGAGPTIKAASGWLKGIGRVADTVAATGITGEARMTRSLNRLAEREATVAEIEGAQVFTNIENKGVAVRLNRGDIEAKDVLAEVIPSMVVREEGSPHSTMIDDLFSSRTLAENGMSHATAVNLVYGVQRMLGRGGQISAGEFDNIIQAAFRAARKHADEVGGGVGKSADDVGARVRFIDEALKADGEALAVNFVGGSGLRTLTDAQHGEMKKLMGKLLGRRHKLTDKQLSKLINYSLSLNDERAMQNVRKAINDFGGLTEEQAAAYSKRVNEVISNGRTAREDAHLQRTLKVERALGLIENEKTIRVLSDLGVSARKVMQYAQKLKSVIGDDDAVRVLDSEFRGVREAIEEISDGDGLEVLDKTPAAWNVEKFLGEADITGKLRELKELRSKLRRRASKVAAKQAEKGGDAGLEKRLGRLADKARKRYQELSAELGIRLDQEEAYASLLARIKEDIPYAARTQVEKDTILGQALDRLILRASPDAIEIGAENRNRAWFASMFKDTSLGRRMERLLASVSLWPQTQQRLFRSRNRVVRGFSNWLTGQHVSARMYSNSTDFMSIESIVEGASREALPFMNTMKAIRANLGEQNFRLFDVTFMVMRQRGLLRGTADEYDLSDVPAELIEAYAQAGGKDALAQDLKSAQRAYTSFMGRALEEAEEAGFPMGIDATRYVPNSIQGGLSAERANKFVEDFLKLRRTQLIEDNARLDLETLHSLGWIRLTTGGEVDARGRRLANKKFEVPEDSPFYVSNDIDVNVRFTEAAIKGRYSGLIEMDNAITAPARSSGQLSEGGVYYQGVIGADDLTFMTGDSVATRISEAFEIAGNDPAMPLGRSADAATSDKAAADAIAGLDSEIQKMEEAYNLLASMSEGARARVADWAGVPAESLMEDLSNTMLARRRVLHAHVVRQTRHTKPNLRRVPMSSQDIVTAAQDVNVYRQLSPGHDALATRLEGMMAEGLINEEAAALIRAMYADIDPTKMTAMSFTRLDILDDRRFAEATVAADDMGTATSTGRVAITRTQDLVGDSTTTAVATATAVAHEVSHLAFLSAPPRLQGVLQGLYNSVTRGENNEILDLFRHFGINVDYATSDVHEFVAHLAQISMLQNRVDIRTPETKQLFKRLRNFMRRLIGNLFFSDDNANAPVKSAMREILGDEKADTINSAMKSIMDDIEADEAADRIQSLFDRVRATDEIDVFGEANEAALSRSAGMRSRLAEARTELQKLQKLKLELEAGGKTPDEIDELNRLQAKAPDDLSEEEVARMVLLSNKGGSEEQRVLREMDDEIARAQEKVNNLESELASEANLKGGEKLEAQAPAKAPAPAEGAPLPKSKAKKFVQADATKVHRAIKEADNSDAIHSFEIYGKMDQADGMFPEDSIGRTKEFAGKSLEDGDIIKVASYERNGDLWDDHYLYWDGKDWNVMDDMSMDELDSFYRGADEAVEEEAPVPAKPKPRNAVAIESELRSLERQMADVDGESDEFLELASRYKEVRTEYNDMKVKPSGLHPLKTDDEIELLRGSNSRREVKEAVNKTAERQVEKRAAKKVEQEAKSPAPKTAEEAAERLPELVDNIIMRYVTQHHKGNVASAAAEEAQEAITEILYLGKNPLLRDGWPVDDSGKYYTPEDVYYLATTRHTEAEYEAEVAKAEQQGKRALTPNANVVGKRNSIKRRGAGGDRRGEAEKKKDKATKARIKELNKKAQSGPLTDDETAELFQLENPGRARLSGEEATDEAIRNAAATPGIRSSEADAAEELEITIELGLSSSDKKAKTAARKLEDARLLAAAMERRGILEETGERGGYKLTDDQITELAEETGLAEGAIARHNHKGGLLHGPSIQSREEIISNATTNENREMLKAEKAARKAEVRARAEEEETAATPAVQDMVAETSTGQRGKTTVEQAADEGTIPGLPGYTRFTQDQLDSMIDDIDDPFAFVNAAKQSESGEGAAYSRELAAMWYKRREETGAPLPGAKPDMEDMTTTEVVNTGRTPVTSETLSDLIREDPAAAADIITTWSGVNPDRFDPDRWLEENGHTSDEAAPATARAVEEGEPDELAELVDDVSAGGAGGKPPKPPKAPAGAGDFDEDELAGVFSRRLAAAIETNRLPSDYGLELAELLIEAADDGNFIRSSQELGLTLDEMVDVGLGFQVLRGELSMDVSGPTPSSRLAGGDADDVSRPSDKELRARYEEEAAARLDAEAEFEAAALERMSTAGTEADADDAARMAAARLIRGAKSMSDDALLGELDRLDLLIKEGKGTKLDRKVRRRLMRELDHRTKTTKPRELPALDEYMKRRSVRKADGNFNHQHRLAHTGKGLAELYREAVNGNTDLLSPAYRATQEAEGLTPVSALERVGRNYLEHSGGRFKTSFDSGVQDMNQHINAISSVNNLHARTFTDYDLDSEGGDGLAQLFAEGSNSMEGLMRYADTTLGSIRVQKGVNELTGEKGVSMMEMFDQVEKALKANLMRDDSGRTRTLVAEDVQREVTQYMQELKELYLRSRGINPRKDQSFSQASRIAQNLAYSILGAKFAMSVLFVETPMAVLRTSGLNPLKMIQNTGTILGGYMRAANNAAIQYKPLQKFMSAMGMDVRIMKESVDDMTYALSNLRSNSMSRFGAGSEAMEDSGLLFTIGDRIRAHLSNVRGAAAGEGVSDPNMLRRLLDMLEAGTAMSADLTGMMSFMHPVTNAVREVAVNQGKATLFKHSEKLFLLARRMDRSGEVTTDQIIGMARELGIPRQLAVYAAESGLLRHRGGLINGLMAWGEVTAASAGRDLDMNVLGTRLQQARTHYMETANGTAFDTAGRAVADELDEIIPSLNHYLMLVTNELSPEMRGTMRFQGMNPLTDLLFQMLSYPMAAYQALVANGITARGPIMTAGVLATLTALEYYNRNAQRALLGKEEEDRQAALDKMTRIPTQDDVIELLAVYGTSSPMFGAIGNYVRDLVGNPILRGTGHPDRNFPATPYRSPAIGMLQKLYGGLSKTAGAAGTAIREDDPGAMATALGNLGEMAMDVSPLNALGLGQVAEAAGNIMSPSDLHKAIALGQNVGGQQGTEGFSYPPQENVNYLKWFNSTEPASSLGDLAPSPSAPAPVRTGNAPAVDRPNQPKPEIRGVPSSAGEGLADKLAGKDTKASAAPAPAEAAPEALPEAPPEAPPEVEKVQLSPKEEKDFQKFWRTNGRVKAWREQFVRQYGEEPWLDTPHYDYRAAWKAGDRPVKNPDHVVNGEAMYHWSSVGKSKDHPTAWKEEAWKATGENPDKSGLTKAEWLKIKNGE